MPEHIRALTSQHVLDVEADLSGRLAVRGAEPGCDIDLSQAAQPAPAGGRRLDAGQWAAVAALGGDRALLVIEGAAGAGKTTTLSAARDLLTAQGRRLLVVTPTLKAAKVAHAEVGAQASSAAWLAYQYGWRWDQHGSWTRLHIGDADPVTGRQYAGPQERARLRAGDLVVLDEAGMVDQDTARALLSIADQHSARVAFLGDRHQLSAVGRGGVLDLAHRWAAPEACLTLDVVHRFTRDTANADGTTSTVTDVDYAALTIAMRTGEHPADVFDVLLSRGQIQLHSSAADSQDTLANTAAAQFAAGQELAVGADTREQVNELNAAIRERLVATGHVDDHNATTTTGSGRRIGVGDRVATRRNDPALDVANRDTWIATGVGDTGELAVTHPRAGDRLLPAGYVREHVELAYASTAHGVQGDTVTAAHLVLGEHTGAASAYVGMTRGRQDNTAHLVASDLQEAREQWVAAFARDRADLGPAHAADQAARDAAHYAQPRPLDDVLTELRQAWEVEQRCLDRLDRDEDRRDLLREIIPLHCEHAVEFEAVEERYRQSRNASAQADSRLDGCRAFITGDAGEIRGRLLHQWDNQRDAARDAAQIVRAGPGRLGLRLAAVNRATETLARWSVDWQPYLAAMPTDSAQIAHYASWADDRPHLRDEFDDYAHRQAEHAHPEHASLQAAAETAATAHQQAWRAYADSTRRHHDQLAYYGAIGHTDNPDERLAGLERDITATQTEVAAAQHAIAGLVAEPALTTQPVDRLSHERDMWQIRRDLRHAESTATRVADRGEDAWHRMHQNERHAHQAADHHRGPSMSR